LSKIALGFENQDTLTSSGITLASVRYIYLSGTDKVIRAKQGKVGAHCVKTQQSKLKFSKILYSDLVYYNIIFDLCVITDNIGTA